MIPKAHPWRFWGEALEHVFNEYSGESGRKSGLGNRVLSNTQEVTEERQCVVIHIQPSKNHHRL